MTNLIQRIITGTIGAAIVISGMLWNVYSFCAVMFILSFAVHFEYMSLIQHFKEGGRRWLEWAIVLGTGVCFFILLLMNYLPGINGKATIAVFIPILPFLAGMFIFELYAKRQFPFQNAGLNIAGIFYCVMPFILLCIAGLLNTENTASSGKSYEPWMVLGYFFIVWSNDTFAFFTGKAIGKRKLFERISPHKTWEGFFGGMAASLICAFVLSLFFDFITRVDWLAIGLIVSIFGTLGDLTESMLKRSLQVKDSSGVLPGHGGFLDRFDATLLAAPFVFAYLMLRI